MKKTIIFSAISASVLLLNGCAAALPSPQISSHHADKPFSAMVSNAKTAHFCSDKKCVAQHFYSKGPGPVAVAEYLHLGDWSPHAHRNSSSTLGSGMMVAGANLVPGPAGIALFLLGASSKGSLPDWAAHYHYMKISMNDGTLMQVVSVYPLGNDPEQASKMAAITLGQQSLGFLGELRDPDGKKVAVHGSEYQESYSPPHNYLYFIGASKADSRGNLSVKWWTRNSLTGLGTVFMGESSNDSTIGTPGNLVRSAKELAPNSYVLTNIKCMPVPGDSGTAVAVATFLFKGPSLFTGTPYYKEAINAFRDDYVVARTDRQPESIVIWHDLHPQVVSLPSLK